MAATFPVKVPITAVDRFSQVLSKMGGAAGRWGARISSAGKKLTLGLTVPTIALGVASAKTGITFQRSLNRVQATTQASAEEIAGLRKQAETLSGQTHTLTEVADAMALLAEKGEDVLSIQAETPAVLKLATIANVDLGEAVEFTTDALEVYGKGADQAAGMTDLLAAASQRTNLGSLMEALRLAGPRARATGQDLRGLVSLLDVLADEGFEGAKGGSAVVAMLTALVKPGAKARKELEGLGIRRSDLQNADGSVKELVDVLDLLAERGAGATQVLRIFGEGGDAAAAILEKKLTTAVRSGAATLVDVDGRAQDLVNTLTSGGVDSATRFGDAWERVGVALAESGLLDALAQGIELVGGLARKFEGLSPATKKWIVIAGGIAAVVGPALVVIGSAVTSISALVGVLGTLGPAIGGVLAVLGPIAVIAASVHSLAQDLPKIFDIVVGMNKEAAEREADAAFFATHSRPAMDAGAFKVQGQPLGPKRLERAAAAGAEAQRAEVGGAIRVDFKNMPKGARVETRPEGPVGLDVTAGVNLAGAL